ncbi:hypothetical protein DC498_10885 [Terrimonas sp.]|uniref:hypothetical protein n=1 Tax=Terrimonas sp. TaxID=1914338 RepID=UPI000D50BCFB|nr:hypothetical protein [Terrimonas sp.]PVD52220.1 hypothetical protein DC498_10885 [Terrimonas sp.]
MLNNQEIKHRDWKEIHVNADKEKYALDWLDVLVYHTLNPKKGKLLGISKDEETKIFYQIEEEFLKISLTIQTQVFSVQSRSEAELLIRNYYSTLTTMLRQCILNLEMVRLKKGAIHRIAKALLQLTEELILLIEYKYFEYLSMNEFVSQTYFLKFCKELSLRLNKLQGKVPVNNPQQIPFNIIAHKISSFINTGKFEYTTTHSNIIYKEKLLSEIEKIDFAEKSPPAYTLIDAVLIYLNFNSVEYINYLIGYIESSIRKKNTIEEKKAKLLFLYKSFNQLHKIPNISYNKNFHSIETVINNWFRHEISYQQKLNTTKTQSESKEEKAKELTTSSEKNHKIICLLSSDQIGLILRAASDQKVIISKSLNELFKTIVPYMSTPVKESLSHDGMRSKAYAAEEKDKRIAIETLEKLIRKIKDF